MTAMTAMAAWTPACVPIGAREIQARSRQFLSRGLLLSSLCHLTLLSLFLFILARTRTLEVAWDYQRATFIETLPRILLPQPQTAPPAGARREDAGGAVTPTEKELLEELEPRWSPAERRPIDGRNGERVDDASGSPSARIESSDDPDEGAFVPLDQEPIVIERRIPDYPDWARDAGISGRVLLHVLVGKDGRVKRITVVQGVTGLTESARAAVATWFFRPAQANGHAIAVWVAVPVEFRL